MTGRFVPPVGAPRILAAAQLTTSIGDGVYCVCSALYFARVVGLSPAQIGFGLTLGWAVGAVLGVPLGHLADRHGPRAVATLLAVCTGGSVAALLVVRSFMPFVLAVCLYASCQCGLAAARQALLAGLIAPADRTRIRAYLQSAANAGLAIGAGLGGLALQSDGRAGFLVVFAVDAAGFLAAVPLIRRLPAVAPAPAVPGGGPALAVLRDRPYTVITLLHMVMLLYMPLLTLAVPLWVLRRTAAPTWMVSVMFVVNTLSVVLFQVRAARRVNGLRTAVRLVRRAGVLLLAACAVFALSAAGRSAWLAGAILLAAVAVQVLGEMLLASGAWEIAFTLAPADRQGQYQGFFGTGTALARMLGPLSLTTLVVGWGTPGWLALGMLFLLAGTAMGPAVRRAERDRAGNKGNRRSERRRTGSGGAARRPGGSAAPPEPRHGPSAVRPAGPVEVRRRDRNGQLSRARA